MDNTMINKDLVSKVPSYLIAMETEKYGYGKGEKITDPSTLKEKDVIVVLFKLRGKTQVYIIEEDGKLPLVNSELVSRNLGKKMQLTFDHVVDIYKFNNDIKDLIMEKEGLKPKKGGRRRTHRRKSHRRRRTFHRRK